MKVKAIATGTTLLVLMFLAMGVTASTSQVTSNQTTLLRGAYFYVWAGWNSTSQTWQGGQFTSHWNDAPERSFLDRPLSWYSSMNDTIIAWQLSEMRKAKLNFVAISWWGPNDYTDESMRHFVQYLDVTNDTLQFVILIEPYNGLNITEAQNYVWVLYQMYGAHVFQWEGKPLLMSFLPVIPTDNVRFTVRVSGNGGLENWEYVQGMPTWFNGTNKVIKEEIASYVDGPTITSDGVVVLIPRFDNYYEYSIGGRSDYIRFNIESNPMMLQQGIQWAETHGARLVMITSFNEYTEGSMIEPHYSASGRYVDFVASVLASS